MPIIRAANVNIDNNEITLLTAAVAAAGTTLTVQNNEGFSNSDYVVLEKMGSELAEIVKIDTTSGISGNTTIVTGATKFAHVVDTPITYIKYNQVRFYRATSKTGTYTLQTTVNMEVDQLFTEWDDTSGSITNWYKIAYYNSTTSLAGAQSDPVKGTGYADNTLRMILNKIYKIGNDPDRKIISEAEMVDFVNDAYRLGIDRMVNVDRKFYMKSAYVDITNSYNTGTIDTTDSSASVTGTSTVWSTGWSNKKIIFNDEGYPYEIFSFGSSTTLTLTRTYNGSGSNLDDVAYVIYQDEYTLYDASTGEAIADFRSIERVVDEEGLEVHEFDMHRRENGYYIKRVDDNLEFCLNYRPSTDGDAGRWEILYIYQPARLDSMGDTPELPVGADGLLVNYGIARIKERAEDETKKQYYDGKFEMGLRNMIRRQTERTNKVKGWRIDRGLRRTNTDADWFEEKYSRKGIS